MDLPLGAQGLQPGDEQLADFFLSEQFANLRRYFGERNFGGSGFFQLGHKLVAIISLDGLGINLYGRTKPGVDQTHNVNLLPDMLLHILLYEMVLGENSSPGLIGSGLRI